MDKIVTDGTGIKYRLKKCPDIKKDCILSKCVAHTLKRAYRLVPGGESGEIATPYCTKYKMGVYEEAG